MKLYSSLFLVFLTIACPVRADPIDPNGFETIFKDEFESLRIIEFLSEYLIQPGEPTSDHGVSVSAIGEEAAEVVFSRAAYANEEPGLLIEIEGGPVSIDLTSAELAKGISTNALSYSSCPDPESSDYPIRYCLVATTEVLAAISYPGDAIRGARIPAPGTSLREEPSFNGFRSIYLSSPIPVSALKSACVDPVNCLGDPVLLIHGYQAEKSLSGYGLTDNGGRNYWGFFPERLFADGYAPYEFIWHTNARFRDVASDLNAALDILHSKTGKKVHIVAHSFGGILARRLLQCPSSECPDLAGTADSVASLTTIGSPHLGVFDKKTNYRNLGVVFPKGQDSLLFEGHNQISPHIMGENAFGSSIASLLEFETNPGSEAFFLATNTPFLPEIDIQALIGFMKYGDQRLFPLTEGDGLITGWSQRFDPDLVIDTEGNLKWEAPYFNKTGFGNSKITEWFLGRQSKDEGAPYLEPNGVPAPEDFLAFKHSNATVTGNVKQFDKLEVEVSASGFHDTYQRVLDFIGGPKQTPPVLVKGPLNDTGVDWGASYPTWNNETCVGETIEAQDCSHGRDKTDDDDSDGHAGFSFTKLDADGNVLPRNASNWRCVKDEVTGLVWEVKSRDGGLQDADNTYSWFNPDPRFNGGVAGNQNQGSCAGSSCDTHGYVIAINNLQVPLCGARDWRMPFREELRSIMDYGAPDGPMIDFDFFPNAEGSWHWTSSPFRYFLYAYTAWAMSFGNGVDDYQSRYLGNRVRLVRNGD